MKKAGKEKAKGELKEGDLVIKDDTVEFQFNENVKNEKLKDKKTSLHRLQAEKFAKAGKGTIVSAMLALLFLLGIGFQEVKAQQITGQPRYYTMVSTYGSSSDTTINTATAVLTTPEIKTNYKNVTIQMLVTEISGTTAGTVTLQGSLDGTNWDTATDATSVPTITTKSPADVTTTQSFTWKYYNGSPYSYYRISYAGAGTMSARFSAKVFVH